MFRLWIRGFLALALICVSIQPQSIFSEDTGQDGGVQLQREKEEVLPTNAQPEHLKSSSRDDTELHIRLPGRTSFSGLPSPERVSSLVIEGDGTYAPAVMNNPMITFIGRCTSLQEITLRDVVGDLSGVLLALSKITSLRSLTISTFEEFTRPADWASLNLAEIRRLSLSVGHVPEELVGAILQAKHIEELHLGGTFVDAASIAKITTSRSLVSLDVLAYSPGSRIIPVASLRLGDQHKLTHLGIEGFHVQVAELREILALPKLQSLEVTRSSGLSGAQLASTCISKLTRLSYCSTGMALNIDKSTILKELAITVSELSNVRISGDGKLCVHDLRLYGIINQYAIHNVPLILESFTIQGGVHLSIGAGGLVGDACWDTVGPLLDIPKLRSLGMRGLLFARVANAKSTISPQLLSGTLTQLDMSYCVLNDALWAEILSRGAIRDLRSTSAIGSGILQQYVAVAGADIRTLSVENIGWEDSEHFVSICGALTGAARVAMNVGNQHKSVVGEAAIAEGFQQLASAAKQLEILQIRHHHEMTIESARSLRSLAKLRAVHIRSIELRLSVFIELAANDRLATLAHTGRVAADVDIGQMELGKNLAMLRFGAGPLKPGDMVRGKLREKFPDTIIE